MLKQAYRPDIDGLRAIAVLAVVFYHAFPARFPGGFVGVDIFFVISGFLISGIVFADLDSNRFSFVDFYRRRVNRIFPALTVVLAAVLSAGWFMLLPDEFRELGLQALAGAGSFANVLFWYQSGYFDAASSSKPLLHLWSLGVEEQFYLLWPMLLAGLHRRGRSAWFAIVTVMVVSFVWNIATVRIYPTAAFYLPMSRLWELGLGALLAYARLTPHAAARFAPLAETQPAASPEAQPVPLRALPPAVLSTVGLCLLAASFMLIKPAAQFPGWWALLPCVGAACLIAARDALPNRHWLAHPVMVFIGRISYPWYLWHWVLLTMPALAIGAELSRSARLLAIAVSFVFAWLTYELVEKRVRARRHTLLRPAALVVFMGLAAVAGVLVYATDGVASRYPSSIRNLVDLRHDAEKERYRGVWRMGTCFLSEEQAFDALDGAECAPLLPADQPLIALWGDSHAAALYPGIQSMRANVRFRLAQFTKAECLPIVGMDSFPSCTHSNQAVFARIAALKPRTVILGGDWSADLAEDEGRFRVHMMQLRRTITALKDAGVERIIVFGSVPKWTINQPRVALRLWQQSGVLPERTLRYVDSSAAAADSRIAAAAQGSGAVFVSPLELLCDARGCLLSADTLTSVPISWDKGHLTEAGSILLVKLAANRIF